MKTVAGLLLTTLLTMSAGCTQTDWIDRTLVTVDVTGAWFGVAQGRGVRLELEQQGSTVKGFVRYLEAPGTSTGIYVAGPVEGTVAGDVFRFRDTRGSLRGELTVSGDEMNGLVSLFGQRSLSLRRVDSFSFSPPASPPR